MHSADTGGGGEGGAPGGRCGGGGEGGAKGGVHLLSVRSRAMAPSFATVEPAPCITYLSTWSCRPNSLWTTAAHCGSITHRCPASVMSTPLKPRSGGPSCEVLSRT